MLFKSVTNLYFLLQHLYSSCTIFSVIMASKDNGEVLLFILVELKMIIDWKIQKSSMNTVVSISWSRWTLYRLYLFLISSRKEFGEAEWNDLSKNGARAEELESCGTVILQSQNISLTSFLMGEQHREQCLSVLALFFWFFDKSLWLLEAPTHFCTHMFLVSQIFPGKAPSAWSWRSALEQWCTNDLTV